MSQAFEKGVRENLPNAKITFDKFHVFQALNKAIDETRSIEAKESNLLAKTNFKTDF
jgi:transposase